MINMQRRELTHSKMEFVKLAVQCQILAGIQYIVQNQDHLAAETPRSFLE